MSNESHAGKRNEPPRSSSSTRMRPARDSVRKGWTAPAGRGMRFLVAQKFGTVRYVKARKTWEIDARPYGRFRSIPVQGAKSIPFSSEEVAEESKLSVSGVRKRFRILKERASHLKVEWQ